MLSLAKNEITAEKVKIGEVFNDFWFIIPEYQRSYVWESDNINDLLDDLFFAMSNKANSEYFLGSLVLQKTSNEDFYEFEVLDGQQRLTTLYLLIAVIRDLAKDDDLKQAFQGMLAQKANKYKGIPERNRINYKIRDKVEDFLKDFVLNKNATLKMNELQENSNADNISISNMAKAILTMKDYLSHKISEIESLAEFLSRKVVVIYVSTENRGNAFRLFTILNNRGIPLTNADILKTLNIGEITDEKLNQKYAIIWEEIEGNLGEDFDRFLSFIRTILVKEKARVNLLDEFEENIYNRKLLKKGKETIDFMKKYKDIYDSIIKLEEDKLENAFKNLITIMLIGLPSDDWIPPLMFYYEKFGNTKLVQFLEKLEYKFSGDWILQRTPTDRIDYMNRILKEIEKCSDVDSIINNTVLFEVEKNTLRSILEQNVYGRRFARYILLKYEYLVSDNTVHLSDYKTISVEHVLPQSPKIGSEWLNKFSSGERENWTHKLANLVLISKKKNSSLSNLDFKQKKEKYLKNRIDVFTGSKIFINSQDDWTPNILKIRQIEMINKLIS